MTTPQVSLVCVPRERFSFARESLESLYANTDWPFRLMYVDNGAPGSLRRWLRAQSAVRGFELVKAPHFLSPNQARNLGLAEARTQDAKYIVFVDNDVVFETGWLERLVRCAEETGATVVGPLVCQHEPLHSIIHCAGGEFMPDADLLRFRLEPQPTLPVAGPGQQRWRIQEKIYQQGEPVEACDREHRPTGFVEFHCVLVRRSFLDEHGPLDERFLTTKEYLDLAMTVARAGGSVWLEPSARVTFRTHFPAPPLAFSDLPYFMLRWSDRWMIENLAYMRNKWDLVDDAYFQKRYRKLGWRRRIEILRPLGRHMPFLNETGSEWVTDRLALAEKRLNRFVTDRHAARVGRATADSGGMHA
ncbi:MAG: glycosyltransferase [Proteobacteria bacterium]|nr:glycosyltransferase [Pseudomonadota bacterium]